MIDPKKLIVSGKIDLNKIGWSEYKSDAQASEYIKRFVKETYGKEIDDDTTIIISDIIDNLIDE